MSICTCTPKQKDTGRFSRRCTAHTGYPTSAHLPRKRPSRTIPARDVPTEDMRYDLRALGLDVGEMDDAEVRREFERRFGPVLPRNPNHPHPAR